MNRPKTLSSRTVPADSPSPTPWMGPDRRRGPLPRRRVPRHGGTASHVGASSAKSRRLPAPPSPASPSTAPPTPAPPAGSTSASLRPLPRFSTCAPKPTAYGNATSRRVTSDEAAGFCFGLLGRGRAGDLARLDAGGAHVQALGRTGDDGPNGLDVRVPTTAGTDVRVRHVVAEARPLAANVADGSHGCLHKIGWLSLTAPHPAAMYTPTQN